MQFLSIGSRLTLHASSPRSITLAQLHFTSLAVVSLREDFHLQDRAHAGRANAKAGSSDPAFHSDVSESDYLNLRSPAIPIRPRPRSSMVAGSGTPAGAVSPMILKAGRYPEELEVNVPPNVGKT